MKIIKEAKNILGLGLKEVISSFTDRQKFLLKAFQQFFKKMLRKRMVRNSLRNS